MGQEIPLPLCYGLSKAASSVSAMVFDAVGGCTADHAPSPSLPGYESECTASADVSEMVVLHKLKKNLSYEKLQQIVLIACDVEKSVTPNLYPGTLNFFGYFFDLKIASH